MRERRKIAACPKASLFRNDRMNAAVQKLEYQLEGFYSNARESACERICADQHDRPHSRNVQRLADADGVT